MGMGEKSQQGGPQALCLQRVGEQNLDTSWAFGNAKHPPLVSRSQVGVGRNNTSEAVWQSCVLSSWAGSPEEVGGGMWPWGNTCLSPDLAPQMTFRDLSVYSALVLFSCLSTQVVSQGERTLSDKAGKPKVHSIPLSSLVNEGEGVQCS